jgi:glycerol-3-phosphate dehydrogenase (NAD(P)+)
MPLKVIHSTRNPSSFSVTVVGAGSWGTTLAVLLSGKGCSVALWARKEPLVEKMRATRENREYLPGVRLPQNLSITSSLKEALEDAGIIVSCVPSHGVRDVFGEAARYIPAGCMIVSASKGIEETTLFTCSSVLKDVLKGNPVVVFSGPTFAKEVSRGLPAAACVASEDRKRCLEAQEVFSTPYFRVYTNSDPVGVELGGALKNVIAIAAGISDGLGLGNNARAALITRGLKEMTVLGEKLGADTRTFYGLSGLGDLVLTCTAALSRNYTVGLEIGRGKTLSVALSSMKMVAEGVKTTASVKKLSESRNVEMPISGGVYGVLYENKNPRQAVMELMTRELKGEL